MEPQQRLVNVLEQITKRYYSIVFSKLILLDQEEQTGDHYIRHYDIECEAVESLADTLNTKIKAIQFRSFYLIKNYTKESLFKRKPKTHNNSYIHNFSNSSFYSKNNLGISFRQRTHFPNTTRAYGTNKESNHQNSKLLSEIDQSMSALMSKMKYLNSRFAEKTGQDPQMHSQSQKFLKRKLIITKLNQLENGLSELINEEQSNGNINYMSSSNVTLRYKPTIKRDYKTSRQVNKTFF